jgi:hypothetical protein
MIQSNAIAKIDNVDESLTNQWITFSFLLNQRSLCLGQPLSWSPQHWQACLARTMSAVLKDTRLQSKKCL